MHRQRLQARWQALLICTVTLGLALAACRTQPEPPPAAELPPEPPRFGEPGWEPDTLEAAMARLDNREDWTPDGEHLHFPKHPGEKYLEGMVIVLDPGHGGAAAWEGYKRGPTGVREAEMNLRTAHLLRKLLEDAGVIVHLTREAETSDIADDTMTPRGSTLRLRAEMANNIERPDGTTGADLFISIHYNASSRETANYTSIWYHGDTDSAEVELDIARHIAFNTFRTMRTSEVGLTSPLLSDQLMYSAGFGVLKHTRVPAILLELSFFSHPVEEQRLRDPHYNLKAAYGIYLGLVDYAYGGRPTQTTPEATIEDTEMVITTTLDDGMPDWWGSDRQRIVSSTIQLTLDGVTIPHTFDPQTHLLTARVALPENDAQPRRLTVHHANYHKHHNYPQRYAIELNTDDTQTAATVNPIGRPRYNNDLGRID
ncbi:N-acetylmuramoyl-L-alanine amidase family protein [Mucisphaera sp.]|uniref:N-acetylmuramoyl-L-alanine amidase family protein n=1 Tax=Mucisphaera sp. TaxID=2913024 RepID=UPI003D0E21B0